MADRPRIWPRAVAVPVLAAMIVGGACGGNADAKSRGTAQKDVSEIPADLVPSMLLGLPVTREDAKKILAGRDRTYLSALGLYSLRAEDLVQATLQVSRFNNDAEFKSARFRAAVVAQVGSTKARQARVGDDTVFLTSGTRQRITVWFKGEYLFVLAVRDEFEQPRKLLRAALEIKP